MNKRPISRAKAWREARSAISPALLLVLIGVEGTLFCIHVYHNVVYHNVKGTAGQTLVHFWYILYLETDREKPYPLDVFEVNKLCDPTRRSLWKDLTIKPVNCQGARNGRLERV